MILDYRNTEYCPTLEKINCRKQKLKTKILTEHPKVTNFYEWTKNKYKKDFLCAYNSKCSYCGNSIDNISFSLFEVDHYIIKEKFSTLIEAGAFENIVIACKDCNRSKHDFIIPEGYLDILHPDKTKIVKVFCRDPKYYIRISDVYGGDPVVVSFYNKLKLFHETRRLDYLLLQMRGFSNTKKGAVMHDKLEAAISKLQCKRNRMECK